MIMANSACIFAGVLDVDRTVGLSFLAVVLFTLLYASTW